jgi:nucleoside-diphosphate-sugar epimerase
VRRLLLTGASGFIGSQAVGLLLRRGFEVHAVGRREPAAELVNPRSGQTDGPGRAPELAGGLADGESGALVWHRADLLDADATHALVQQVRPTHLLHFAWYAKHGDFWSSTENLRWVEASLGLLRAFGEYGGQRAAIAGTCAEYDWSKVGRCVEGQSPLASQTLYGVSKDALRRVAQAWARKEGISLAWGRIFFVFGEREQPQRLVPSFARAVLSKQPALCSHGRQLRDFLHTADVAGAFVALLDSTVEGPVNIGSGERVSIGELVSVVGEAAGGLELVRLGELPERSGEPRELSADVTRLRQEVGWTPTLTLQQGVERAVHWQRCQLERSAGGGDAPSEEAAIGSTSEGPISEGSSSERPTSEGSSSRTAEMAPAPDGASSAAEDAT